MQAPEADLQSGAQLRISNLLKLSEQALDGGLDGLMPPQLRSYCGRVRRSAAAVHPDVRSEGTFFSPFETLAFPEESRDCDADLNGRLSQV